MNRQNRHAHHPASDFLGRLLALVFAVMVCASAWAAGGSGPITIKKSKVSVAQAFADIKKQAKVIVMYESNTVDEDLNITLNLDHASLQEAMTDICRKAGLEYEVKGKYVLVTRAAQLTRGGEGTNVIRGRVVDEKGLPLPGATVMILNSKAGTITDDNGYYIIRANRGDRIKYSYIGMTSIEKTVGEGSVINIEFKEHSQRLMEVEVVSNGYQALPKDRATGSFSTISSTELKKVPTPNVLQRMEGKLAGMKVSLYSGDKTFTYDNTLQSASSSTRTLGASDYSLGIRGVSTLNGEKMPIIVIDGVISEMDISNIDPSVIDNITVLKDAAAASIWGARAANGVIVITTKKGVKGQKPQISLSASWTTQNRPDLGYLNLLSSSDLLDYEKELVDKGYLYSSTPYGYYSATTVHNRGVQLALDLKAGNITQEEYDAEAARLGAIDNRSQVGKYLLQRANSQQYNINVSGGGANSSYYYSASYAKENPYTKGNSGQRLNLNLSNTWKLFNWATLTANFTGTFFTYKENGLGLRGLYGDASGLVTYENLADENGEGIEYDRYDPTWVASLGSGYKKWTYNYLQEMALKDNTQRTDNYTGNINLNIPIAYGLSSSTTLAVERSYTRSTTWYDENSYYIRDIMNYYTPAGATTNTLGITNGALYKLTSDNRNWTIREQLNFDHTFNGIHRVNALAGLEMRQTYVEQGSMTMWGYNRDTGIVDTNINFNSSSATYGTVAGYDSGFYYGGYPNEVNRKRRYISYYANAGYTLLDRYYLSASVRYDDYNNFGLSRKYRAHPFWSLGAKWNISREKFMENAKWVNNLAVRLTYGVNGNISLGSYPFTKLYVTSNYITYQPSYGISAVANPELRWEKTYATNLGIDFSLLGNRLFGSIDYYNKRSRDLVYTFDVAAPIVGTLNNGQMERNCVAINSHGIDVSINGVAYRNKDWNVTIGANLAWNKNTVQDNPLFKESQYLSYYNYYPVGIGQIAGYSTDKLLAFRYAGLDETGQPLVYNENDEKVSVSETISSLAALKDCGHTTPTVYGGLNLNLSWKQFTLYSLFTYQFGSSFFRPTMSSYVTYNGAKWDLSDDIAQRWREPGDEATTNVPGITSSYIAVNRYKYSDVNVLKGDYLRWKQVSLSYQLASSLCQKLHLANASVSLTMSNLGLLWRANDAGIDPDYANGYNTYSLPPKKAYTLSLNIGF